MDENTEQLYGREGIEQSQGYTPMPEPPAETAADSSPLDDDRLRKYSDRPAEADFGELTERSYVDSNDAGKRRDEHETVEADRAAEDLTAIRKAERDARERELDDATAAAVDDLRRQVTEQPPHQQPQQQQQAQPEALQPDFQPQAETAQPEFQIDPDIAAALQNPKIRGMLEQTSAHVQAAQANYAQGVAAAVNEVQTIFGTIFPELAGINNPEQLRGAVAVMAAQNPQRVEQLKQFYGRAQNVMAAQQQIQHAEQQAAMERADLFRQMEVKRFEAATAHIPEETMKALRNSALPTVEKYCGITEQEMRALTSGKQKVDSYTFVHSLPFQLMLMDAVRFRTSQDAISRAAVRPVPQVQRPGVSEPSKVDAGEVSAALARFNREGGNLGRDGLRNAAAVVAARRARS